MVHSVEDKPDEFVDFSVKYKEWVAIRRLAITSATKPEEIAYHLAGIRSSIDSKMFQILGIDVGMIEKYAKDATSGMRSGFPSLLEAMKLVEQPDAKKIIADACPSPTLKPFARTYMLNRLIASVGVDTSLSQLALSKTFKYLKPPKAPGRMAKGLKPLA